MIRKVNMYTTVQKSQENFLKPLKHTKVHIEQGGHIQIEHHSNSV